MTTIAFESICKWNNRGKCQCKMITLSKKGSCYDKEPPPAIHITGGDVSENQGRPQRPPA